MKNKIKVYVCVDSSCRSNPLRKAKTWRGSIECYTNREIAKRMVALHEKIISCTLNQN